MGLDGYQTACVFCHGYEALSIGRDCLSSSYVDVVVVLGDRAVCSRCRLERLWYSYRDYCVVMSGKYRFWA